LDTFDLLTRWAWVRVPRRDLAPLLLRELPEPHCRAVRTLPEAVGLAAGQWASRRAKDCAFSVVLALAAYEMGHTLAPLAYREWGFGL